MARDDLMYCISREILMTERFRIDDVTSFFGRWFLRLDSSAGFFGADVDKYYDSCTRGIMTAWLLANEEAL